MICEATPATPENRPGFYANMGGPMSRTRKELVQSTLLGKDHGRIRCPRFISLGLDFGAASPLDTLRDLLDMEGYASPETLRYDFPLPERRLICRPLRPKAERLSVKDAEPGIVLAQALMLGLCTSQLFDPNRPVLWTEASLTRGLELFATEGFYA